MGNDSVAGIANNVVADDNALFPARPLRLDINGLPVFSALGRIAPRAKAAIERNGIETIRTLQAWLRTVDVLAEPNYGRATHRDLLRQIDRLLHDGPHRIVFGRDVPPSNLSELATAYLEHLPDDRDRAFIRRHVVEGETLESIGTSCSPPLTRERVRQIVERNFIADQPSWIAQTQLVLAPVLERVEMGGGLAPLDSCLALGQGQHAWELDLASMIAGSDLTVRWAGHYGVATTLSSDEYQFLRTQLRDQAERYLLSADDYSGVVELLHQWGIYLPLPDERSLLTGFLGIQVAGDVVYSGRRPMQSVFLEALRLAGEARTASEIALDAASIDPDCTATARNAVIHLGRSNQAFSFRKGKWIHEDNLGFPSSLLREIASECLTHVPQDGRTVNVRHLLKRVTTGRTLPPDLTEYLVRDVMLHSGLVRGWRAGCDVAWKGVEVSRQGISSWLEETAAKLEQPFSLSELVSEVVNQSGHLETSVRMQAHLVETLLMLNADEYVSRLALFQNESEFLKARDAAASLIPSDDLVSAKQLSARCPELQSLVKQYGNDVLWAVTRTQAGVESRLCGHLLWKSSFANNTWSAVRGSHRYNLPPVFRARTLNQHLRKTYGVEESQLAYVLLHDAKEAGDVSSCAPGWYLDKRVDPLEVNQWIVNIPELKSIVRSQ